MKPTRDVRRWAASQAARFAVAVLAAAVLVGCSDAEKFCTLGAALPSVEVDVTALPGAREVCVDDDCVPVRDGTAELTSPVIENATRDARLSVRGADDTVLTNAVVRLPRFYANGRDCGGDAPVGTVTFGPDGGVGVSEDTVGGDG